MDRLTIEKWKDVDGYEGLYQVSNQGKVKSFKWREEGMVLKQSRVGGYLYVSLCKCGKERSISVHRLVASAFCPNPEGNSEVNHKNEYKACNYAWNLEWCTAQYNVEYSKAKSYTFRSPEGKKVEVYNLSKFCRDNNLYDSAMHRVFNGKLSHHKSWSLWKPGCIEGIKFKPEATNRIYRFISPDGNLTEVNNLSKFAKENRLDQGGLSAVHSGKRSHHKGWSKQ